MTDARLLLTDRLELRPMTTADAEELFVILGDPRAWEYDPGKRHTCVEQTRGYAERAEARWADGLSYWTVRLRPTGEVVGSGGAQRHPGGFWNLNYRIAPDHQGRGYASEVGRTALALAHAIDAAAPVIAWIDSSNRASRRVAARLGLTDRGQRLGSVDGRPRLAYADRVLDERTFPRVPVS